MDSIHFAMCLDYRISPEVFQQIENLVNRYSHGNFNFYARPAPWGIGIIAEEFTKSKGKFYCKQFFPMEEINLRIEKDQLESLIDFIVRHLIEEINQQKLLKI